MLDPELPPVDGLESHHVPQLRDLGLAPISNEIDSSGRRHIIHSTLSIVIPHLGRDRAHGICCVRAKHPIMQDAECSMSYLYLKH